MKAVLPDNGTVNNCQSYNVYYPIFGDFFFFLRGVVGRILYQRHYQQCLILTKMNSKHLTAAQYQTETTDVDISGAGGAGNNTS